MNDAARRTVFVAALAGFIAVAAGAFGAHALRARLEPSMLAVFETGVRYLMFHALALLALGLWLRDAPRPLPHWAAGCFALGAAIFAGSLMLLALTGVRALGAVAPIGGLLLLAGWALLSVAALRR